MPRKKKTVETITEPEATAETPQSITIEVPAPEPGPEPTCSADVHGKPCGKSFDWRDIAYGAAARGLCRKHGRQRQRAILRGSYAMERTLTGAKPAISQGTTRKQRRDEQFNRTAKMTARRAA